MIQVGQQIGNYQITAKLGEGGMGVVYLAEHPVIGKKVALKAIHPELSRNPEVTSRFMTEAKSVNQIGNDHIVDISDFGTTSEGEFYFIMEFLQGEALADRLKREKVFAPNRALQIGAQVADALSGSHSHGIIHRDLKPENIFLITRANSNDFVKVLDFGLAKLTQGDEKVTHKTRTGSVMGTPYYMAPEQCEGKANIDHRADVYSLGVIMFEMMTGKVPFGGEGYGEIIVKHITMEPPSPRAINPLLTLAHEAIIYRALAKNREQRFQNMDDLRVAMLDPERYLASGPQTPFSLNTTPAPVMLGRDQSAARRLATTSPTDLGATSEPMPSTFRDGAGELGDDLDLPKSRKGLILGVVGAVALAAVAAVVLSRKGTTESPTGSATTTTQVGQPTPTHPVAPEKVKITFSSEPAGAKVVRKDTGQELGITKFEADIAQGKDAIEFVFRKDGFEDKTMSLVPEGSAELAAALKSVKPAHEPVAESTPRPTGVGKTGGGKAAAGGKGGKSKGVSSGKKTNKPLDEDGVLEPSFK